MMPNVGRHNNDNQMVSEPPPMYTDGCGLVPIYVWWNDEEEKNLSQGNNVKVWGRAAGGHLLKCDDFEDDDDNDGG